MKSYCSLNRIRSIDIIYGIKDRKCMQQKFSKFVQKYFFVIEYLLTFDIKPNIIAVNTCKIEEKVAKNKT